MVLEQDRDDQGCAAPHMHRPERSGPWKPQGEGERCRWHLRGCRELAVLERGFENGLGLE